MAHEYLNIKEIFWKIFDTSQKQKLKIFWTVVKYTTKNILQFPKYERIIISKILQFQMLWKYFVDILDWFYYHLKSFLENFENILSAIFWNTLKIFFSDKKKIPNKNTYF